MQIFEIEKHGLPNMTDKTLIGRIAFIFDGCIVSGWPLKNGNWEADSDVGRQGEFHKDAVKKYVIFDVPIQCL